jgi:hypothetical protein
MQSKSGKLQASFGDDSFFTQFSEHLDLKSFSSAVSMCVWGLIMAKAKTGFSAALSKEKEVVSYSYKRFIQLIVLVGVASLFKLNADY